MKVRPPSVSWVVAATEPQATRNTGPTTRPGGFDRLSLGRFEQMVRRLIAEQSPREEMDIDRLEAARCQLESGELNSHLDQVADAILEESEWVGQWLEK